MFTLKRKLIISILLLGALILISLLFTTSSRFLIFRISDIKESPESKISFLEKFTKDHPSFSPARIKLAEYYVLMSQSKEKENYLEKAIGQYKSVLESDPKNISVLDGIVDINSILGHPESSFPFLKELVKLDPDNIQGLLLLSSLYEKEGNLSTAIHLCKQALDASIAQLDKKSEFHSAYYLGNLYAKSRLFFDAREQFEKALTLHPGAISTYILLAKVYNSLGLGDKTILMITSSPLSPTQMDTASLITTFPGKLKSEIYSLLGTAYLQKKDYRKALEHFKNARIYGAEMPDLFMDSLQNRASRQKEDIKNRTADAQDPRPLSDIFEEISGVDLEAQIEKKEFKPVFDKIKQDPLAWKNAGTKYPKGSVVSCRIIRITPYVLVLEIEESGVQGIMFSTDTSWTSPYSIPGGMFSIGETIDTKVLDIKEEDQYLRLGVKQLSEDPWLEKVENYTAGTSLRATITEITPLGITFDTGADLSGFIYFHNIPIGTGQLLTELYSVGDEVEVTIVNIDADKRKMSFSIKPKTQDE